MTEVNPLVIDKDTLTNFLGELGLDSSLNEEDPAEFVLATTPVEEYVAESTFESGELEEEPRVESKKSSEPVYSEMDIKNAVLHLIKPAAQWKREYPITLGLTVWLRPTNDKQDAELNNYYLKIVSSGDRRVRVDTVDAFTDPQTKKTIPGGRTETEYYYNPDQERAVRRAETAAYLVELAGEDTSNMNLEQKIKVLEVYSPFILDAIFEKAIRPFVGLLAEAKKQILNF